MRRQPQRELWLTPCHPGQDMPKASMVAPLLEPRGRWGLDQEGVDCQWGLE